MDADGSNGRNQKKGMRRGISARVVETARRVKRAAISDLQRDADGFLTLGTLLAAKRGEVKRVVRTSDQSGGLLEHWLWDSEMAIGNTITLAQFEAEMTGRAATSERGEAQSPSRNGENGIHSAASSPERDPDDENSKRTCSPASADFVANGKAALRAAGSGSSRLHALPPLNNGAHHPPLSRGGSARSVISRTASSAPPQLAPQFGRRNLPMHEGGGIESEWFHAQSADPHVLNLLRDVFNVDEQHLMDVAHPSQHQHGPTVAFSQGASPQDDYLFLVAHELHLEYTKAKLQPQPAHKSFFGSQIFRAHVAPEHEQDLGAEGSQPPPQPKGGSSISNWARRLSQEGKKEEEAERDAGSDLQLEEVQLACFYFPDRSLLISIGNSHESEIVKAARRVLQNKRSVVRKDCIDSLSGGASSLLIVLLDSLMDQVFPILDIYGDALEGLGLLLSREPSHMHVRLSHKLKTRVTQIRRYLWDAKGLFMELKQDICGCIDKKKLLATLIDSTDQMDKEAESYLHTCTSIENFYASFQDSRMNKTLFTLTTATICLLPLQCLSGIWGMNFTEMPELEWEYGYVMFWCIALSLIGIAGQFRGKRVH